MNNFSLSEDKSDFLKSLGFENTYKLAEPSQLCGKKFSMEKWEKNENGKRITLYVHFSETYENECELYYGDEEDEDETITFNEKDLIEEMKRRELEKRKY